MAGCCGGGSCSCKIQAGDDSITITGLGTTGNPFLITATGGGGGSETVHGTGSPEGIVTAEIGRRYIDDSSTNGAVEWMKSTDGGDTGWRVTYGDTGWRNISADLVNGWHVEDVIAIRRINDFTHVMVRILTKLSVSPGLVVLGPMPGFQPLDAVDHMPLNLAPPGDLADPAQPEYLATLLGASGSFLVSQMSIPAGADWYYSGQGLIPLTNVPWPAVLPGFPLV